MRSSPTSPPSSRVQIELQGDAAAGGALLDEGYGVLQSARQMERGRGQLHAASLDLGQIQDIVDEREQVLTGCVDVLEVFILLVVELAEHPLDQHLREADDGIEGRAELMRHVGEKLRLVATGRLELPALLFGLAEQAHVLDRNDGLVGKGLQQVDLAGRRTARVRRGSTAMAPIGAPSRSIGTKRPLRQPTARDSA